MTTQQPRFHSIDILTADPNCLFKAIIHGNPRALQRPRMSMPRMLRFRRSSSRGHGIRLFNPSHGEQLAMRNLIEDALETTINGTAGGDSGFFFEEGTALHVNLVFHMHRPASHFKIGRGRSLESLKENFRNCQHIRTPDVDNMVKFVLDSPLDGVIYKNDSHVVSIGAHKCYDIVGECLGRTKPLAILFEMDLKSIEHTEGYLAIKIHYH
jgi:hypothetical protein